MRTGIYYFSGTGNSLRIAGSLKERLDNAEVVPIIPLLKNELIVPEYQSIGIVFPIQSFSYPWIAAEFLSKLYYSGVDYLFAIASSHCFYHVFKDLEKTTPGRRRIDACFAIEMPQNYIPMFRLPSPEQIEKADRNMEEALDFAVKIISEKKTYRPKDSPLWFPVSHLMFPLLTGYFRKIRLPEMGRSFYADEKCSGCGICEKLCPSGRIKMENGRPRWLNEIKCTYCFACLHLCPGQSVQIKGRNTAKIGRYHHPSINVKDIISQKRG